MILTLFLTACSTTPKYTQVQLPADRLRSQYESKANRFMISTQGTGTSQAGIEVLQKGGNIYDAFTAISFAISVERPHSTGLGGGGFIVFYNAQDKKTYALDFRETAPRKAHSKMFLGPNGKADPKLSVVGALAIATPGHVAGVLEVHKKHGKLNLKEVLAPAIRLASEGFPVYPALHRALKIEKDNLAQFPSSKKIFLDPQGEPWPVGHILKQQDLAKSLKLIAEKGPDVFYEGSIAKKIASTVKRHKGILDQTDLKNYKSKWRAPVQSTYQNYQIFSQPPPSSGGAHVIQILNMVEKDDLRQWGPQDPRSIHITASAMQKAFSDRAQYMGDPDFVKVPTEKLISKSYADHTRSEIQMDKARKAQEFIMKEESPDTTHFSLMDAEGNAIASTQTVNGYFGSALVAEGTGIMLNNEMDDFAAEVGAQNIYGAVGGKNNLVEPLKRPLSSMSPTIVLKDGQPFMSLGTPSGTRIITCVAQTLLNVLEYELPLWDAVTLTRYHQQWQPDVLTIESPTFKKSTLEELKKKGHTIVERDLGCRIQAIQKNGDVLHGVSDPREEGSSRGL